MAKRSNIGEAPEDMSKQEIQNGLDLLWMYLQATECKAKDGVTKHEVSQTYDYFNRIGYSDARPRWEG